MNFSAGTRLSRSPLSETLLEAAWIAVRNPVVGERWRCLVGLFSDTVLGSLGRFAVEGC